MNKINGLAKFTTGLALAILAAMFLLMQGSVWKDSATFDEVAHIPAGFANLTKLDYRFNPEHPPLIKVLSALSAELVLYPNFPTDIPAWREATEGRWWIQFDYGKKFLYASGNDPDRILFWARFPVMLLGILLGWILFGWTRVRFGNTAAFLALLLYAFSPTVLAHSRYVTTDLGAALGFFIGFAAFVRFLETQEYRNIAYAGVAFGAAQLLKFSAIMLVPIFGIILIAWVWSRPRLYLYERARVFLRLAGKIMLLGVIGLGVVWLMYGLFTWNYPQDRQLREAEALLASNGAKSAVKFDLALIENRFTRPLGQYALGVLMANQRAAGGNTSYFLGEVSSQGSRLYFPLLYLLKESLVLHILTLIALLFALQKYRISLRSGFSFYVKSRLWVLNNFAEFAMLAAVGFYWIVSIASPLNIGIRHILPTFPFIYILVSRNISRWLRAHDDADAKTWLSWLSNIFQMYVKAIPKYIFLSFLLLWLVMETLLSFPHYLSYYNTLAGGTRKGYLVATDSNYDWGQDLKRLADFVEKNNIQKIAVDYFGGGDLEYYFGEKAVAWQSSFGYPSELARGPSLRSGQIPDGIWLAISANSRQGAFAKIGPGFSRSPEDSYEWLKPYDPVAQVGSMFVYKLP